MQERHLISSTNTSPDTPATRIAVAGAGLIGLRHVAAIRQTPGVILSALVDPLPAAAELAAQAGVPWFATLKDLFDSAPPDGVILATPNAVHVENGLACVAAGVPMLVEKPLSTDAASGVALLQAAEAAGIAVLVGHHRRYNPLIARAADLIADGALGDIRAVQATCWLFKPDDYFEVAPWRTQPGAGPVAVNLIHDVDLLRHLVGDIVCVQAVAAPSARGHRNEDVASAVLTFANGAIGTISVADGIVAPWSWELTARENPAYPPTDQSCYLIGGSHGSMSLPDLRVWHSQGPRSWWAPMTATTHPSAHGDPLVTQIAHFADVIAGRATPLVSGADGLAALRVIEAIATAAATGKAVHLSGEANGGPAS